MKHLILIGFFSLISSGAFADGSTVCDLSTGQTLQVSDNQGTSVELTGGLTIDLDNSLDGYSHDESVYLRAYDSGPTLVFEATWSRDLNSPPPNNGEFTTANLIVYSKGYPSGLVICCQYQN